MNEKSSAPITGGWSVWHFVRSDHLARDGGGEIGLLRRIDRHRIVAAIVERDGDAGGGGDSGDDLAKAPLDEVAHRRRQRAHRAFELGGLRQDVVGDAGGEARHRDDAGVERVDVARNDRLQRRDDLRAGDDDVDAMVRKGGVAALAFELEDEEIGRRHRRALADRRFRRPASFGALCRA